MPDYSSGRGYGRGGGYPGLSSRSGNDVDALGNTVFPVRRVSNESESPKTSNIYGQNRQRYPTNPYGQDQQMYPPANSYGRNSPYPSPNNLAPASGNTYSMNQNAYSQYPIQGTGYPNSVYGGITGFRQPTVRGRGYYGLYEPSPVSQAPAYGSNYVRHMQRQNSQPNNYYNPFSNENVRKYTIEQKNPQANYLSTNPTPENTSQPQPENNTNRVIQENEPNFQQAPRYSSGYEDQTNRDASQDNLPTTLYPTTHDLPQNMPINLYEAESLPSISGCGNLFAEPTEPERNTEENENFFESIYNLTPVNNFVKFGKN